VTSELEVGLNRLTIEQVLALARGEAVPRLPRDGAWTALIERGVRSVQEKLQAGSTVYGVSTGVGDSVVNAVPPELAEQLQANLVRFHGCGTGRILSELEAAAVVAVRLASLSRGWSAVRLEVLQRLCDLLRLRILPAIPAQGSVGASGDLTPLSYVAAVACGEREVLGGGDALQALRAANLLPLKLQAKEALSLMNGTSVMTALGCIAFEQSLRLARLAASLTAMASDVTRGNQAHFDPRIFLAKPHPGQAACARWIAQDIGYDRAKPRKVERVQDRYSIRCAPHVIGVLLDAEPFLRSTLQTELNGADDNPLIDPETGDVLHGGNFYGGHVCLAMDLLKNTVANLADLMDRQMALICNPAMNEGGLPANLVFGAGPAHHGFKAMQIATSALAAEALKLTMPASVFSRSTECHNQDKVSMGTIAARDCLTILDLTETVAAIHLLALCQAVDIQKGKECGPRALELHTAVRAFVPANTADRRMDGEIAAVLAALRGDRLPIGERT